MPSNTSSYESLNSAHCLRLVSMSSDSVARRFLIYAYLGGAATTKQPDLNA